MNMQRKIAFATLVALCGGGTLAAAPAGAAAPSPQALFPANRIVGMWKVTVTIGPCSGGPQNTFTAFNTFHLGGTLSDTNDHAAATRSPGQGVWQYTGHGTYRNHMQFFRFLPPAWTYDGIQDVHNTIQLDPQAMQYTTTVYARMLNVDGSLRKEFCGSAIGERIGVE